MASTQEVYEEIMESLNMNDVSFNKVKCQSCEDSKCKAYRVTVNERTLVFFSQCRKLKIIDNKKDMDEYWEVDLTDFFSAVKRDVSDLF